MTGTEAAVARTLRVLETVSDAFTTSDWGRLRSLYHDDARIVSVAGGDRVLGPDELVELLADVERGSYSTDDAQTEALDESAVVIWGIVRRRNDVGTNFTTSAWLLTFRDGLVWRSKTYRSMDAARAAYDEHGLDLGIT